MPASMISAPTGGRAKVIGSSIAMVASGPIPGSTPISVPTIAPTKHRKMFIGNGMVMPRNPILRSMNWNTTPKPSARLVMRSMSGPLEPRPELQRQVQPPREQQRAEGGEHRGPDQRLDPADLLGGVGRNDERHEASEDKTERAHRDGKDERRGGDEDRPARRHAHQQERQQQHHGRAEGRNDDVGSDTGENVADADGIVGDR